MKKLIITCIILTIPFLPVYADINDILGQDKPMSIDISSNPVSINGTYSVERFIIIKSNKIFIDSKDSYIVEDAKGEVTINLNITNNNIESTLKMQMSGNVFKEGSAYAGYDYIYTKRLIPLPKNKDNEKINLADKVSKVGLHYYKENGKLVWEIPFENDKLIIMILDKKSNKVKNIKNTRYMFL